MIDTRTGKPGHAQPARRLVSDLIQRKGPRTGRRQNGFLRATDMETQMKILVATDGSKFSALAVNYLVAHADQFKDAQVTLLTVHLPIPGRAAAQLGREVVRDYYGAECEKALKPARSALKKAGIAFTDTWTVGNPGDEISEFATKGKFDMVVMGSHGHGFFGALMLGSVATRVLAGCKVPVLVIR